MQFRAFLIPLVTMAAMTLAKAACASDSGIQLMVTLGPTCPVQTIGQNCERPYAAAIAVYSESGQLIMTAHTGSDGRGRIALRPGTYELRPKTPDPARALPRAKPVTITVEPGEYASANIQYDTGIR